MKLSIFKKSSQKGFTLVEMIVSLALFTVVAVVAIGALLKVLDANRKSINLKNATNNINFALESMSRELRVGSNYLITNPGGDSIIEFRSSKSSPSCDITIAYKYNSSEETIQKAQSGCGGNNLSFQDLISPDVKVTSFSMVGSTDTYVKIDISLTGYTGVREKDKVYFSMQTSVSQSLR